jgi:hypothetical protein
MKISRSKLAARGLATIALGVGGIYSAECLECWQPHGAALTALCVALVLASMCLAILGPLVLGRALRPREEKAQEEEAPSDSHMESALDRWSWVVWLQGICILAPMPIIVYQLLRSSSALLPMSFVGGILLVSCANEFWPKMVERWRTVVVGSTSRAVKRRLLAAFGVSVAITTTISVFIAKLILAQPVVGLVSATLGLVGTTCAAFLAGHTDGSAQQSVQPDRA